MAYVLVLCDRSPTISRLTPATNPAGLVAADDWAIGSDCAAEAALGLANTAGTTPATTATATVTATTACEYKGLDQPIKMLPLQLLSKRILR